MILNKRGIIFTGESVRGILSGAKTQTRRVIKWRKDLENGSWIKSIHVDGGGNWIAWSSDEPGLADFTKRAYPKGEGFICPYGKIGDHLWVRETWAHRISGIAYRADDNLSGIKWKSPIFMPRIYSRITLEITDVRVERLKEITERDARAEGYLDCPLDPLQWFQRAWHQINGKKFPWESNCWLWVIEFRRI